MQWVEHSVRPSVGRRIQPERSMGQDEFPLCGNGQAGMPILLKAWIPAFAGTTSIRQTGPEIQIEGFLPEQTDIKFMRRALELALQGRGSVSPNPRVGAVIVSPDGKVLGEGYHHKYGESHAEVEAIKACGGADTNGATIYVTLEPCCHRGKTPPCSQAVIKAGIKRIVIASDDPNPKVNGCGISDVRSAGLEVVSGVLEKEARYMNRGYFTLREKNRAWCSAKIALSIDGKMANLDGESKWITGPEARKYAHTLRADHDAIMVGGSTVWNDNPELTVRSVEGPDPVRLVLAPHRGIPVDSKIGTSLNDVPTVLFTSDDATPEGLDLPGLKVHRFQMDKNGRIDPVDILKTLPQYGILSVMIEGGSYVLSSFMDAGVIDELAIGTAPSVVGTGVSPFDKFDPVTWEKRPRFREGIVRKSGTDFITTYLREDSSFSLD